MVTEQRFTVARMRFVRRPVSSPPPDGTVCFVDDGDLRGWKSGQTAALYKDGEWSNGKGKPLRITPTFWTDMEGPVGG